MKNRYMVLFILIAALMNCNHSPKYHSGGPYYYSTFADYHIPFKPIDELTENKAKNRKVYYMAYFDDKGKIVTFTKYFDGKIEFSSSFSYRPDESLEKQENTNMEGKRINYFLNGSIVKSEIIDLKGQKTIKYFNNDKK
jgi:hypothetical protein